MTLDPERILFTVYHYTSLETTPPDASVSCLCCNETIQYKDWGEHAGTSRHRLMTEQHTTLIATEKKLWQNRRDAKRLADRVALLLAQTQQDDMKSKLLHFVFNPDEPLVTMERTLERYEYMDRLVLLELAVWKAACLLRRPKGPINDCIDMMEWMATGWMELKEEARASTMFTIIVPHVIRFLGAA